MFLILRSVFAAMAILPSAVWHGLRSYGSRKNQIERRQMGPAPDEKTPERRKDDDVGGED